MALAIAKEYRWKDLDLDFEPHPMTDDIRQRYDEQAIESSIRNLVFTKRGEKLMRPNFGSRVAGLLFENWSMGMAHVLKTEIRNLIELHEPRAEVVSISVDDRTELNAIEVSLTYRLVNTELIREMNFLIKRLR